MLIGSLEFPFERTRTGFMKGGFEWTGPKMWLPAITKTNVQTKNTSWRDWSLGNFPPIYGRRLHIYFKCFCYCFPCASCWSRWTYSVCFALMTSNQTCSNRESMCVSDDTFPLAHYNTHDRYLWNGFLGKCMRRLFPEMNQIIVMWFLTSYPPPETWILWAQTL